MAGDPPVDLVCARCGTSFTIPAWRFRQGQRGIIPPPRYCSKPCIRRSSQRPDDATLRDLYVKQRLTTRAIGVRFGVRHITVRRWLIKYGVPLRPSGRGLQNRGATPPSRDELHDLVHVQHLSYSAIGSLFGVDGSAVQSWLRKHHIDLPVAWDTRKRKRRPALPETQVLAALYQSGLSLVEIGRRYERDPNNIAHTLRTHGVAIRDDGFGKGARIIGADGHRLRSTYEYRVCRWLDEHNITHIYEPPLPFSRTMRGDFLANGWYIEVWGMQNDPVYRARRERKVALYALHGLPLIELNTDFFSTRRRDQFNRRMEICLNAPPVNVQLSLALE